MSWTLESEGMEGLPESRAAWREGGRERILCSCHVLTHAEDVCSMYMDVYCGNYKLDS